MKTASLIFLASLMTIAAHAAPAGRALSGPITLQGVWNRSAQSFLMQKGREILTHQLGYDPFNHTLAGANHFEAPLAVEMKSLVSDILGGLIHEDLNKVNIVVDIADARYSIEDPGFYIEMEETNQPSILRPIFHTQPKNFAVTASEVVIRFKADAKSPLSEMVLRLKNVRFSSAEMKSLSLRIPSQLEIDPAGTTTFSFAPDVQDLFSKIKAEDLQDDISLEVGHAVFDGGFSLQIGGIQNTVTEEKLLKAIQVRKRYISLIVLKPVAELIGNLPQVISKNLLAGQNSITFKTAWKQAIGNHTLDIALRDMSAFDDLLRVNLSVTVDGDVSPLAPKTADSLSEDMQHGLSHLALSVHENTLSLIASTLVESLISNDESLKRLKLGTEKVRFVFDDPLHPKIVADLIVNAGSVSRVVLGKRFIRVPVVIEPQIKVDYGMGFPNLEIGIAKIDLDNETLFKGAYGIESTFGKVRFKKAIAKKLRKIVAKKLSSICKDIHLESLAGQKLDYLKVQNDGEGRLNFKFALNPTENDSAKTFWAGLLEFVAQVKIQKN